MSIFSERLVYMYVQTACTSSEASKGEGKYSLIPSPFEEEEKRPGIHCTCMCEVYRAFSSIIRRICHYHAVRSVETRYEVGEA